MAHSGTRLFRKPRKQRHISARLQKHIALGCTQHEWEDGIGIWVPGEAALWCTSELLILYKFHAKLMPSCHSDAWPHAAPCNASILQNIPASWKILIPQAFDQG